MEYSPADLLQAFDGAGDLNHDGQMTSSELGVFLKTAVTQETQKRQNPIIWTLVRRRRNRFCRTKGTGSANRRTYCLENW